MAGKMGVRTLLIHSLLLSAAVATPLNYLFKRASTCYAIHAKSDNGNRKVAIVVDSSGSMSESDPANLRLSAGVELTDWLISNKEATTSVPADMVSVINFDDVPTLDYPLGDPGNADSAFNGIGADGGTFIAGGLQMAIQQIVGGPAPTAQRSGIVVFTDGEVRRVYHRRSSVNTSAGQRCHRTRRRHQQRYLPGHSRLVWLPRRRRQPARSQRPTGDRKVRRTVQHHVQ
jgi:hypothetical protein